MTGKAFLVLFVAVLGFAGCSSDDSATGPAPTTERSFVNDVLPIFAQNCNGCHGQGGPAVGILDLTKNTYLRLVNAPSNTAAGWKLVVAGKPDSSLLYLKVALATPPVGVRMPKDLTPLPGTDIIKIKDWIEQGAKNN
ncbi:MAG: hypothetical protein GXO82_02670 [Chlorobi bacterium]|nr:hypothetical protein [Chlorobiota bacterium]